MFETRMECHWGRVMRCYAARPATVVEMVAATCAAHPDREAVIDDRSRLTYEELGVLVDRAAAGLHSLGVRRGDRVALLVGNRAEFVIGCLAIVRAGAAVVPLGTRLRRPEIEYICRDSGAVGILFDAAHADELPRAETGADLRFRVAIGGKVEGTLAFDDLAASDAPLPDPGLDEDDVFGILYTSGTTGRPKGAMLTHLGAVHSCLHWVDCLGLEVAAEKTVMAVPASHVAGLCGVVLPFLLQAGCIVLMAEFKARRFLELAAAERATHALMVPAMFALCLLEPDLETFDLHAWRTGVFGSAPMPEPTIRRFARAVPGLAMCNAYGATETTSPATIMPRGAGIEHSDSIGRVVTCGDIVVMDEAGREVPPGEAGELWIAGPMVVPGYWRNPEADAGSFAGGYWKSGDIGSVDRDGFVRIYDRKKDMLNRGGFKVYPAEVENVLSDHPAVLDVAVVGKPDDILGERVVAFVQAAPEATEQDLRAFCSARMADYKVPDRVVLMTDALPRNANGKLQKQELRQMARDL